MRSGLVAAIEADIQKHCAVTPDDVERIVANFDRRMDPGRPRDVPIAGSRDTIDFETTSLYATMANIFKTLQHRRHPLVLTFALTDFKVQ